MDTHLVQVSIGEKVPILVQILATFITGYCVAYARNARLAGVLTVLLPLQVFVGNMSELSWELADGQWVASCRKP